MIITCPNCGARYKVRDDLISEKGKRVKCKKCTAVFRVNTEGQSKLEKAPESAPEAQPAAPAARQFKVNVGAPATEESKPAESKSADSPKVPPISAGATVRVDRSQLEDFLKQHQPPAQPDDMPEPPPGFDEPAAQTPPVVEPPEEGPSSSTVAVDRSQLDSMLKDQQDQAEQEEEPDTASTMAVDRSQLDQFLQNQQEGPAAEEPADSFAGGADEGYDINQDESESAATMAMDRSQLDAFLQEQGGQQPPVEDDSEAATMAMDPESLQAELRKETERQEEAARVTSHDFAAESSSSEPDFPSDEELGIDAEKQDWDQKAPESDEGFDFDDQTAEQTTPTAPPPLANDPFAADAPAADPSATQRELYTARVEGTEYPNLDLEAIERWIREGRLLEEDELAPMGTSEFKAANTYPSVARYFEQFHGATQAAVSAPESTKKKGFFARLFSMFSKKK